MCIVTETWLNDDDQVWLQNSEFNKMAGNVTTSTDREDEVEA